MPLLPSSIHRARTPLVILTILSLASSIFIFNQYSFHQGYRAGNVAADDSGTPPWGRGKLVAAGESASRTSVTTEIDERKRQAVREAYGKLPMSFEADAGQDGGDGVRFISRGSGYKLFLTPHEAVLALVRPPATAVVGRGAREEASGGDGAAALGGQRDDEAHTPAAAAAVLRMQLVNANPQPPVRGEGELQGKTHHLSGNRPEGWRTNVASFERVRYEGVYPGVDLIYYGNQQHLEYDFVVAPGARAGDIRLALKGVGKIEPTHEGELVLDVDGVEVRQRKPVAYQEIDGVRREVACRYVLKPHHEFGFEVDGYDATRPLVIDPVLIYSRTFGGSGTENRARAFVSDDPLDSPGSIAVDATGSVYVTGSTESVNFPTEVPSQQNFGGGTDAFITKLTADGTGFVYSTYYGGSGEDIARDIAVDASGNAYVTGSTTSSNFPTVNPARPIYRGASDAFVVKLNAAGSAAIYSTYLGSAASTCGSTGSGKDAGYGIAADASGNAYVTGLTASCDFPTLNAFQGGYGGPGLTGGFGFRGDAFVTKLAAAGSIVYSTYLGGNAGDFGASIAVDSSGNAYVTGATLSSNFPLKDPYQSTFHNNQFASSEVFLTKFSPDGTMLVYSTFIGGFGNDYGRNIAVDASNRPYITGNTSFNDFPLVNPIRSQETFSFLTKFQADGSAPIFSTYIDGISKTVALDADGDAYLNTGDALTPDGTAYVYRNGPAGSDIALDSARRIYVTRSVMTPANDRDVVVEKYTAASIFQFNAAAMNVKEADGSVALTVTRTGNTADEMSVDYATIDGSASERSDYTTAQGTLRFAPGETTKTITVFITDDVFAESNETFSLRLSDQDPLRGTATVTIIDNDAVNGANPVAEASFDANFFVRQHYRDFLNREPDLAGQAFWANQIIGCSPQSQCEVRKVNVSAAFFLSIEFQQTGYLVYRFHQAGPNSGERLQFRTFLADTQEIGRGVVVGAAGWEQQLEANKQAFADEFVTRPEFINNNPLSLTAAEYVDGLNARTGGSLSQSERDTLVAGLNNMTETRATVLRKVAEDADFASREFNRAFVLMQYFGYLRRNPNDAPDSNFDGYNFWLAKLNEFNGNFVAAEMVKSFINSSEYRGRFGP